MHFKQAESEKEFRKSIRETLKDILPEDISRRAKRHYTPSRSDLMRWQGILHAQGLGAPHWSVDNGGAGWSGRQRIIFDQELAEAHAPEINVQGLALFGPVLNEFGTKEQKERFREPLLSGKVIWCQGFSEPGAGSDLASLRTRAVRDGENWVITGQKIWTSHAHIADWVFLLARTRPDGKKQDGISFFVIDMKTPGIEVRPILSIDGQHHLNETFYDNVIVPSSNMIGEEGQGWAIAKFLLNNERLFGAADMPNLYKALSRAREIGMAETRNGKPLLLEPSYACRYAKLQFEVDVIEMKLVATTSRNSLSERELSVIGSSLKVKATDVYMAIAEFSMELLGCAGVAHIQDPEADGVSRNQSMPDYAAGVNVVYFHSRAASIYGGTNEIQRNIIVKARFGI